MDFSTPRTSRTGSIASTSSELSRAPTPAPSPALKRTSSRDSITTIILPDPFEGENAPPSYKKSTRSRSVDLYGNEWRRRMGVWYMRRSSSSEGNSSSSEDASESTRRKSSTSSSAPRPISGKEWRRKFGVWYASRQ